MLSGIKYKAQDKVWPSQMVWASNTIEITPSGMPQ